MTRPARALLSIRALAAVWLLAGCASVDFDATSRGAFAGSTVVIWVGAGADSTQGDGRFLYVPLPGQELRFTRPGDADAAEPPLEIMPEPFYTDGGSIPRSVQGLRGLNAWGYGPAYVIHDWLFFARRCLNDEAVNDGEFVTPEIRKIADLRFRDSAEIMAETIRTLILDYDIDGGNEDPGRIVTTITSGPITRELWTRRGQCAEDQISAEHREIVAELQAPAVPDAPTALLRDGARIEAAPIEVPADEIVTGARRVSASGVPFQVVSVISLGN